ncbi:MAG: glutathione S-transferase family protein [Steroidobacteraceae bacterium]
MILIGMFDSPFVRRVAVTLNLLEIPFEHRNWSVGKDFELIRRYNPLGRVPALVLDDGDALIDSAAILDYIDDYVGPERALLPRSGKARRDALRVMAIATGAAEKGVLQLYETVFRPEEKRHQAWVDRCAVQMHAALAELDRLAGARVGHQASDGAWLIGDRMTQADVTASCVFTFLREALAGESAPGYPNVAALSQRCEVLPAFRAVKAEFSAPRASN